MCPYAHVWLLLHSAARRADAQWNMVFLGCKNCKNCKNGKNLSVTYCAAYWAENLFSHVLSHYHQRNIPLKTHTDT